MDYICHWVNSTWSYIISPYMGHKPVMCLQWTASLRPYPCTLVPSNLPSLSTQPQVFHWTVMEGEPGNHVHQLISRPGNEWGLFAMEGTCRKWSCKQNLGWKCHDECSCSVLCKPHLQNWPLALFHCSNLMAAFSCLKFYELSVGAESPQEGPGTPLCRENELRLGFETTLH